MKKLVYSFIQFVTGMIGLFLSFLSLGVLARVAVIAFKLGYSVL
jgi:hypothetical protein